jgi:hypothetical protein
MAVFFNTLGGLNMTEDQLVLQKVRDAIADRALYLALLYRSFSKALPPETVETLAREAIYEYGRLKGKADNEAMTPKKWVEHHVRCGGADLFESQVIEGDKQCEQRMTFCPLIEGWKRLGCDPKEMDLLCDIAMEVDRGRADFHGTAYEIVERLAKGDPFCRLILKD